MTEFRPDMDSRGRTGVIVLAEDDEDTSRVYGLILRHFGYQVVEARTGGQAVRAVREAQPDLVLMDIGLPEMNGVEASRILKSDPATSSILLLAFSASVDSIADMPRDARTFDGYILKPIAPLELARRVGAYLSQSPAANCPGPRDEIDRSIGGDGQVRAHMLAQ
jgi:CheY-like chemotaxis protein